MRFKDPRQLIDGILKKSVLKKLRKNRIHVPRGAKKLLMEIVSVSKKIEEKGLPERFVLRKLKGKLGHGIFLHPDAKPILKGEVIAPYAGEVALVPQDSESDSDYIFGLITGLVLTKEEQRLFDPTRSYRPRRRYSLDLDGEKRGNFTRFINHSTKPNIEAELLQIPANSLGLETGPCEIIYVARKKILPGQQLLVCYEGKDKSYWGALKIKPFFMTPNTFQLNRKLRVISV